jgi:hypothetical protein
MASNVAVVKQNSDKKDIGILITTWQLITQHTVLLDGRSIVCYERKSVSRNNSIRQSSRQGVAHLELVQRAQKLLQQGS